MSARSPAGRTFRWALPRHPHRLDPSRPVLVHCRSGMRSAAACRLLRQMGFREVCNLRGGIDAWG